jgi:hypothetical protein
VDLSFLGMPNPMKKFFIAPLAFMVVASTGFADPFYVDARKPLSEIRVSKQPLSLTLDNPNGNCILTEAKDDKVSIKATTRYKEVFTVEIAGFDTEEASVKVLYPDRASDQVINIGPGEPPPSRSVRLELAVPAAILRNIKIETNNGEIYVQGKFQSESAKGRTFSAKTSNGGIQARDLLAPAGSTAQTSSGSIKLSGINAPLVATTTNGNIEVEGGEGNVNAISSNGNIRVTKRVGKLVEAVTLHGTIFLHNPRVEKESAASTSGNITYTSPKE